MRPLVLVSALAGWLLVPALAGAQDPPPPIPRFAVDVHGIFPNFSGNPALVPSRDLDSQAQLPGFGLGGHVVVSIYPFKWRAVTFGIGGHLVAARAHQDALTVVVPQAATLPAVTERFRYLAPQFSLNFGNGNGWSYLSGGIGRSKWSIVPDDREPLPPDNERLKTIDYGGGARWFAKPHLAFSLDVRFYAINPSTPALGLPPSPRTRLLIIGAGISLK